MTITGRTITYKWRAFSDISSVHHIFHCFIPQQLASCPKTAGLTPLHEGPPLLHVHDGLLDHHFWDLAKLNSNFLLHSSHVLMFTG